MNFTAEEKLMYIVMKAIYDSGIPISFKGSMVLRACLIEAGYSDEFRHTVDIDANWNSNGFPSIEQMRDTIQNAIDKENINLDVNIYRMYGEKRSAGFELIEKSTGEILFTMDIDVNRPISATRIYEVEDFKFRGISPTQIIADKLFVASTYKVFGRIKDVIDLYYLSKIFVFDKTKVIQALTYSERSLGDFYDFINKTGDLKHAYDKFRFSGDVEKPPFEEVYYTVKSYIKDVLPPIKNKEPERSL